MTLRNLGIALLLVFLAYASTLVVEGVGCIVDIAKALL